MTHTQTIQPGQVKQPHIQSGRNNVHSSAKPAVKSNTATVQFGDGEEVDKLVKSITNETTKSLSLWETFTALREQLTHPQTRKVFKGLTLKYGPDLAVPALFAIPVLGWAAGIVAIPFAMWASHKGEQIVREENKKLDKMNPVRQAVKIEAVWNEKPRKDGKPPLNVTERLANKYNKLIEGLFPENSPKVSALRKTLKIKPDARAFKLLDRLVNARQALHEKLLYKVFLAPFDWLYKSLPVVPKSIKMLTLLPKFGVIGLFFLLGKKPKLP